MRKKIEIVADQPIETDIETSTGEGDTPPEFGDHVIAAEETDPAPASAPNQSAPPEGETPLSENSSAPDGAQAYIIALQAEMEELRTQKEEADKKALYLQAEFQNFRVRQKEQTDSLVKYANSELVKQLLPVLDNFERALKAAEQTRNFDALIGGVSGTHKQLLTSLEKAGVSPIESLGKEFDPNFHEAIGHVEESEYPANTVAEELQRGYRLHERVLRPALVKVAQG